MDEKATKEPKKEGSVPYEAPAIVQEEEFETLALACGKAPGGRLLCQTDPSS